MATVSGQFAWEQINIFRFVSDFFFHKISVRYTTPKFEFEKGFSSKYFLDDFNLNKISSYS